MRLNQVGLGPMGVRAAAEFLERDVGPIVGAVDPAHAGRPLRDLVPSAPAELRISPDITSLDTTRAQAALVTTASTVPLVFDTLRELLDRKLHVVSSCEELSFPWLRHPIMAQSLDQRAIRSRRTVLGTGVNPGYLLDTLPVALTGACREVRHVEAGRVQNAHGRRIPFLRKIGVGLDLDTYHRERAAGAIGHAGLPESLHFIAHYLSFQIDRWEETFAPIVAEAERASDLGPIAAGQVAGIHQEARGWTGDDEVVHLLFRASVGEPDPKGWVDLEADPPVRCVFPGGVDGDAATTAMLLNALGSVREVEPGLRTMADVRPPRAQLRRDG